MIFVIPMTFSGMLIYGIFVMLFDSCERSESHDFEMNDREEITKKGNIFARPIEKLMEWSEKCDWL